MNDFKLTLFTLAILLTGYLIGIPTGFFVNESFNNLNQDLGGNVRSESTGIGIIDGDSLTIGTSSPDHEIEIYNTATGTLKIYGSASCDIREDPDGGLTYFTTLNGAWVGSSTDICN